MVIELKYRERHQDARSLPITWKSMNGKGQARSYAHEFLRWKRGKWGQPFRFMEYRSGEGEVSYGGKLLSGPTSESHAGCPAPMYWPSARSECWRKTLA